MIYHQQHSLIIIIITILTNSSHLQTLPLLSFLVFQLGSISCEIFEDYPYHLPCKLIVIY